MVDRNLMTRCLCGSPEFDSICGLRAALLHGLQELTQSQVWTLVRDKNT